jgi:hypothetical protein
MKEDRLLRRGEETRLEDPATGGQKGAKPERFSLLPFDALDEVIRAYNYGAAKYADHNWRRGYKWSLSFDALMRHATAWWEGEDKDPESGLSHLAHAGWHCLCLIWFQLNAKGTDDRYATAQAAGGQEVFIPGSMCHQNGLGRIRGLDGELLSPEELERKSYDDFMETYDPVTRSWFMPNKGGK